MRSGASKAEQELAVLDYIIEVTDIRRRAILHNLPLHNVLGTPQSVLGIPEETLTQEINQAIVSIGGIRATIHSTEGTHKVTLTQWLGPDIEQPEQHRWIGERGTQMGEITAAPHGIREELQNSLAAD